MEINERPALGDIKPGDKVLIRRSHDDMRGRGDADRYIPAIVTKAARIWITIKPTADDRWVEYRMRRDTQAEQTQYYDGRRSFVTPEQAEYDDRIRAVDAVIKDAKVELDGFYQGADRVWTPGRRAALADLIVSLGILTEGNR